MTITIIAAAGAWLTSPAFAQRQPLLDLGAAPQAPPAGQGAGALALAEDLRKQADQIQQRSGAGEREHAMAAARMFARVLLTSGEKAGPQGSQRIVIGRTLARGLPGIDKVIAAMPGPAGEGAAAIAAHDLESAAAALDTATADPWRLARDGLAVLTRVATERSVPDDLFGWIDAAALDDESLTSDADGWAKLPGVTAETAAAIKELDALAEAGSKWAAYRASSRHVRAAVRGAAAALSGTPSWVPEATRRIMGEQFAAAVQELSAEATADAGLTRLRRLARLGELAARVDKLEESPNAKKVRTALAAAMGITSADSAAESHQLTAFDRVLDLAQARTRLADEKTLCRQVRPAWRTLAAVLKPSEQKLELALIEALTRADAMTDPGVAAVIASHRRAIQDMEALASLNAAMVGDGAKGAEPVVQDRWKRVADRVLKLGQELVKPETRETALTGLRELAEQTQMFLKLPGEDSLRATAKDAPDKAPKSGPRSVWAVVTGGREAALLSEISDRRGGWLDGWDKQGYAGAAGDVERLTTLRGLMEVLTDAAAITAEGGGTTAEYAMLQAWPGWELSPDGFGVIASGLSTQTAEAVQLMVGGDSSKCAAMVAKIHTDRAAALLAGKLAAEASRRGAGKGETGDGAALLEVGCGGPVPGVSWMGTYASQIADVCRYAEEAATAKKLGAKDRAEAILKFVNARATVVEVDPAAAR